MATFTRDGKLIHTEADIIGFGDSFYYYTNEKMTKVYCCKHGRRRCVHGCDTSQICLRYEKCKHGKVHVNGWCGHLKCLGENIEVVFRHYSVG